MPQAIKDQEYWKATHNIRVMKRITALIEDIKNIHSQVKENQNH